MPEHPPLSSEELDFIRELFSRQWLGKLPSAHIFEIDGGPLANALLARLGNQASLNLSAKLDDCRMTFPLQVIEDEQHGLQLKMEAPRIFREGDMRRAWRLQLTEPLHLHNINGEESEMQICELTPASLVLISPLHPPPKSFSLWLQLPGGENLPIRGRRIRPINRQRAAYSLRMQNHEHAECLRRFIFEQYRQQHPQLQIAG